jgi:hypothetical protein
MDLWGRSGESLWNAGFDLSVTSVRGVVGKDIGGLGFLAGTGWDRYTGEASVVVGESLSGATGSQATGELRSHRRLYFVGASLTILAFQFSGEVGMAEGFDPRLPSGAVTGFNPGRRSHFGGIAVRLTF